MDRGREREKRSISTTHGLRGYYILLSTAAFPSRMLGGRLTCLVVLLEGMGMHHPPPMALREDATRASPTASRRLSPRLHPARRLPRLLPGRRLGVSPAADRAVAFAVRHSTARDRSALAAAAAASWPAVAAGRSFAERTARLSPARMSIVCSWASKKRLGDEMRSLDYRMKWLNDS